MPNFKLIKRKNSKNWYLQHFNGTYTSYWSCRTTDKSLAKKRADLYMGEVLRMANRPEGGDRPEDISIAAVLSVYQDDHGQDVRSRGTADWINRHLAEYWGDRPIADLTLSAFKTHERDMLKSGWKPASINRVLAILRAALKHAVRNGDLSHAPFVPSLKVAGGRERWLTRDEAARLLRACRHPHLAYLRIFILVALYCAARHSAILELTWDRVDLDHGLIDFRVAGEIQTNKRRPHAPISDKLVSMLRRHRARQLADAKRLGHRAPRFVIEHEGRPLRRINDAFNEACKRAGIQGVRVHDLKHTAISWMLQAGVGAWDVAGISATRVQTIEAVYGHHRPDRLREAVNQAARSSRRQPVL
jgi:integrase